MELDLASLFVLSLFGAGAGGGVVGWLVGRWSSFETALGVGLLLPGLTMAGFFVTFLAEHRTFTQHPDRVDGRVVRLEERTVGEGATEVAVVEFVSPGRGVQHVATGGGTSLEPGDTVVVLPDPSEPSRSRTGRPDELRGGAIAALLFGTFPLSASVFFLLGPYLARRHRPRPLSPRRAATARYLMRAAYTAFVLAFILAGLWSGDTAERLRLLFAILSLGLWLLVAEGIWARRGPEWGLNVGVIAVNFTVWVVVLGVLLDTP